MRRESGSPRAGFTDGCRLPDVASDAGTDPVQEQQVPVTPKLSVQPLGDCFR